MLFRDPYGGDDQGYNKFFENMGYNSLNLVNNLGIIFYFFLFNLLVTMMALKITLFNCKNSANGSIWVFIQIHD
ncbi:UNKNOWN [Stylonychia lemnae]|uniref:Uncharacterized protein n=1 Tax=Stylonychia lemnae TaxID=5949 RepID=A0A078A344_STYLE|nr:UNKNOWN [Stylonychia lemnae]|eukprot:CDW76698.1 UNKNOWN [Stylonychia lemnae]